MTNTYLDDHVWNERRDALAGSILMRAAAALMTGQPVQDRALVDAAIEAVNMEMAEIGLMPESCREADAA